MVSWLMVYRLMTRLSYLGHSRNSVILFFRVPASSLTVSATVPLELNGGTALWILRHSLISLLKHITYMCHISVTYRSLASLAFDGPPLTTSRLFNVPFFYRLQYCRDSDPSTAASVDNNVAIVLSHAVHIAVPVYTCTLGFSFHSNERSATCCVRAR